VLGAEYFAMIKLWLVRSPGSERYSQ